MHVTIREEKLEEAVAVRRVNEEAFGQPQEARLVDLLRARRAVLLSLVATIDDRVVGHTSCSALFAWRRKQATLKEPDSGQWQYCQSSREWALGRS
jgi:predicted N-acetyltransferase YhbS